MPKKPKGQSRKAKNPKLKKGQKPEKKGKK